ncbi:MAG: hypothetical protein NWF07_07175 [Candidatus Bathyarchaeota archaeon]|nr:hypothetical protein [Candidatus Bathyarchaeota archaeon]
MECSITFSSTIFDVWYSITLEVTASREATHPVKSSDSTTSMKHAKRTKENRFLSIRFLPYFVC